MPQPSPRAPTWCASAPPSTARGRTAPSPEQIQKEKPFYINIPAEEIYNEKTQEEILVQGIIDLYYQNKNGEYILVDYKTDYVEQGQEKDLINKYKKQLELYKKALEQALQNKINKCYIYSTRLGEIEVEI